MPNVNLPLPVERYFDSKGGNNVSQTLECFTDDAIVRDNGEDLELKGLAQIGEWMAGTVAGYKLSSEVRSGETRDGGFVASVVVSGEFPGSPYEFAYRFRLQGDKIAELSIDPIGSLAP